MDTDALLNIRNNTLNHWLEVEKTTTNEQNFFEKTRVYTFCVKSNKSHSEIEPSMLDENKRPEGLSFERAEHQTSDETLEVGSPLMVCIKSTTESDFKINQLDQESNKG